jgi:lipid A 3-O-deacylase
LPILRHLPINKFLIKPKHSQLVYGFALEHNAYTPTSIRHTEIIEDDRPFAACLFGKFFIIGNDTVKQRRVSSALSLGVIGPDAGGQQMQETIHRWLNNIPPLGWNHQIKNDFIVNYEASIDQAIYSHNKTFLLAYNVGGRVGTLSDKAFGGFMFMLGHFDNPFKAFNVQLTKYQMYIYAQPQINTIGYDATLQGGLFNTNSPYVISSSNLERFTSQTSFGIVFKLKTLQLEYFRTYLTKEFKTGNEHFWGGIRIATRF